MQQQSTEFIPHDTGQAFSKTKMRLHTASAIRRRQILMSVIRGGGIMLISWLLGLLSAFFGTYPAGLILLCASSSGVPYIFVGLCASLPFTQAPWGYLCAYIGILTLRVAVTLLVGNGRANLRNLPPLPSDKFSKALLQIEDGGFFGSKAALPETQPNVQKPQLFGEAPILRMMTGAIGALIAGGFAIALGGFQYFDLFGTLFLLLAVPLGIRLIVPLFVPEKQHRLSGYVALTAVCMGAVFAARTLAFFGVPISAVLASLFIYLALKRRGFVAGMMCAVGCGIAFDPINSPIFIIGLVLWALCAQLSDRLALAVSLLFALGWSALLGGFWGFASALPTVLITGALLFAADKWLLPAADAAEYDTEDCDFAGESEFARLVTQENRNQSACERTESMAEAFTGLSETFYQLSDKLRRPALLDLRRICDGAFESACMDCPKREICWGSEYSTTLEGIGKLTSALHLAGKADVACLPEALLSACPRTERIVSAANEHCADVTASLLRTEKTHVFAADYCAIADLLTDALKEQGEEFRADPETGERIFKYLSDQGIAVGSIVVNGVRAKRICVRGVGFGAGRTTPDALRQAIENICGTPLGDPVFEISKDSTVMMLCARDRFSVAFDTGVIPASAEVQIDPESPSGDALSCFAGKSSYFYGILTDGMGSGRQAAFSAEVCTVFLEKMLYAGNSPEISLRMLNNYLRSHSDAPEAECSVGVDMVRIDLITGTAHFIKSGAVPAFVIRGKQLLKIKAHTPPIGIMHAVQAQIIPFELSDGDVIVMVSDGVTGGNEDCPWLLSLLGNHPSKDPAVLKETILLHARESGSRDDMSCAVMRISQLGA
ncbi:MAG: SpoIIE family protein phosphatase [Clostridia bacterium]|nr:SpoIIE family protein phosphatase [Clostridia bacterium]